YVSPTGLSTRIGASGRPEHSTSTCGLSVCRGARRGCRAGDRPRGEAHVEVRRAGNEGQDPSRDGELEREILLVAEPESEARAQREDEAAADEGHVANAAAKTDAAGDCERRRGTTALVRGDGDSHGDIHVPREPDPRQASLCSVRQRAEHA